MKQKSDVKRVLCIAGARPNFVKLGPVVRGLQAAGLDFSVVHTGQHYDAKMSDVFFEQLQLPKPDAHLDVGSASHAQQSARIMERFDLHIDHELESGRRVDAVLVVGDVNSTLACTLVAAKRHIPTIHVEAGLRSGDRAMPEELNRLVTDTLGDLLLCSEPSGLEHLKSEGLEHRAKMVGNVMIDVLKAQLAIAQRLDLKTIVPVHAGEYALVTLHRPSNVDNEAALGELCRRLHMFSESTPLVFPIHPRTRARCASFGFLGALEESRTIHLCPPQGYHEFLALSSQAKFIMTDSGGLQEESTVLGIPCLTLRENTERPVTIREGTSTLIGHDFELLERKVKEVLKGDYPIFGPPKLWDGNAGLRVGEAVASLLA